MIKNIVLVGFMGSGKTTIGEMLACKVSYNFIDVDDYIVKNKKMSIPLIFEKKGEGYFRACESKALKKIIDKEQAVIATGGGVVTESKNIELLRKGLVIYLKASPEHIYKNVKDDTNRPLLQTDDMYTSIYSMLDKREDLYNKAAHLVVNVTGKVPEEIVANIIDIIKETYNDEYINN